MGEPRLRPQDPGWPETEAALRHMVQAAQAVRERLLEEAALA